MQTDSYRALTAPSMTCMISLTLILLVYFVTNLVCAFALNSNCKGAMEYIGCIAAKFGHKNFRMVRTTLAHAQMNYQVSQLGYSNQVNAYT